MPQLIACKVCSRKLPVRAKLYCSESCKNQAKVKRRRCVGERRCDCGVIFSVTTRNRAQKFCGLRCARFYKRKPKKACKSCGKLFKPKRRESLYCCRNCANQARNKLGIVACRHCGVKFKQSRTRRVFCSNEHQYQHARRSPEEKREIRRLGRLAWKKNNPGYMRNWKKANLEKVHKWERVRKRRKALKDPTLSSRKLAERWRSWKVNNPDKVAAYNKKDRGSLRRRRKSVKHTIESLLRQATQLDEMFLAQHGEGLQ